MNRPRKNHLSELTQAQKNRYGVYLFICGYQLLRQRLKNYDPYKHRGWV